MEPEIIIIVFVIIIILSIVFATTNLATSMAIMTIVVNIVLLANHLLALDIKRFESKIKETNAAQINYDYINTSEAGPDMNIQPNADRVTDPDFGTTEYKYSLEDEYYNGVKSVNVTKPEHNVAGIAEFTNDIDSNLVMFEKQRQGRIKGTHDAITLKDADFYRHHFDDEFKYAESRVWWEDQPMYYD